MQLPWRCGADGRDRLRTTRPRAKAGGTFGAHRGRTAISCSLHCPVHKYSTESTAPQTFDSTNALMHRYAYVMRPETLPQSYWRFIVRMGPIHPTVLEVRATNRKCCGRELHSTALAAFTTARSAQYIQAIPSYCTYFPGRAPQQPE